MTKDVLVSISGKHIDIMDDPARGYEVGEDGIEVVTPANYYCRNGKHYILYDEVLEGMAGTIKNKISYMQSCIWSRLVTQKVHNGVIMAQIKNW